MKISDREHGNCDAVLPDHYTLPDDFCQAFTPQVTLRVDDVLTV